MAGKFFGIQKKFGGMQGGTLTDGRAATQEDNDTPDPASPIDTDGSGGKEDGTRNLGKEAIQKAGFKKGKK